MLEEAFLNPILQGGTLWRFDDGLESCPVEDVVLVKFIFAEGAEVRDDDRGVDGEGPRRHGEMASAILPYCIVFLLLRHGFRVLGLGQGFVFVFLGDEEVDEEEDVDG